MKVKSKFLSVLLIICMVFCMAPTAVFAADNIPDSVWTDYAATDFAGGTGTKTDPYQINTAEQLAKISKDVGEGNTYQGTYFLLTDNIDLSDHRWIPIGLHKSESNQVAVYHYFHGFIDGNNKTVSGLVVDERTDKNCAGFFGDIRNIQGGDVGAKNLTISNASIYASEEGLTELRAGILAGFVLANSGYQIIFENITVSGSIEIDMTDGYNNVGGMIGYGDRIKATNCKAENISVSGGSNSGGFIGNTSGSVFENCEVSGTVSGAWALGGFVGYTSTANFGDSSTQSVFKKCAADVDISGYDWRLGGFAGFAEYGEFHNCVAYGNVESTVNGWEPKVGGFIGQSGDEDISGSKAEVSDCHATGTVIFESSSSTVGGFVGDCADGTFSNCSFDSEKNSGLNAAGSGDISSGVESGNSNAVLANICEDYYEGHDYSTDWTTDEEPICTVPGSKSHHCLRCGGKTDVTEISALGHSFTNYVYNNNATCTEDGTETAKCDRCDVTDTRIKETTVLGHNAEKIEVKEPTETEAGNIAYWYCERCGKYFKDEALTQEITKEQTVLAATGKPAEPTNPTEPPKDKPETDSPQTGDNSNLILWITLMGASAAGLSGVLLQKRRRSKVK